MANEIEGLHARIDMLQKQIDALDGTIANLVTNINALRGDQASIETLQPPKERRRRHVTAVADLVEGANA